MTTAAPASKKKPAATPAAVEEHPAPLAPAAVAPESVAPAAPAAPATANALSITALVLGITGIFLGQWLLSVAAVVFGFVARGKEPSGRLVANWGLVLGFVGLFGGVILGIFGVAAFLPLWAFSGFGGEFWGLWNF